MAHHRQRRHHYRHIQQSAERPQGKQRSVRDRVPAHPGDGRRHRQVRDHQHRGPNIPRAQAQHIQPAVHQLYHAGHLCADRQVGHTRVSGRGLPEAGGALESPRRDVRRTLQQQD